MQYAFIIPWPLLSQSPLYLPPLAAGRWAGRDAEAWGLSETTCVHPGVLRPARSGRVSRLIGITILQTKEKKAHLGDSISMQTSVQLAPGIPLAGHKSLSRIRNGISQEAYHLLPLWGSVVLFFPCMRSNGKCFRENVYFSTEIQLTCLWNLSRLEKYEDILALAVPGKGSWKFIGWLIKRYPYCSESKFSSFNR